MAKRKKKPKKKSNKVLLKEWSVAVRARDGNVCAVCGKSQYVQAHHILAKKKYPPFKFELDNGLSLCCGHHFGYRESAEGNPLWFARWLEKNRPQQFAKAWQRMETLAANSPEKS